MLTDSKLPHKFWAEALSTHVYLRNRSPTKALTEITPYEAWYGAKPDVSFLRIFGCSAYAHVPKFERHKLDVKSRKCLMLGYGSTQKGYRLYDVEHMKVIHSRDVVFDETSTPSFQKETPTKYVELEVDSDEIKYTESQTDGGMAEPDQVIESPMPTGGNPVLRRSTRNRQAPDWYGDVVTMVSCDQEDPTSVTEAKAAPDKCQWEKAMEAEMKSLQSNNVWELVYPPPNRKVIGSKWIFKCKVNADGVMEHYKARLVAQGCTQRYGLDYEETFSPVVRFESIRVLLAIGAQHNLELRYNTARYNPT